MCKDTKDFELEAYFQFMKHGVLVTLLEIQLIHMNGWSKNCSEGPEFVVLSTIHLVQMAEKKSVFLIFAVFNFCEF